MKDRANSFLKKEYSPQKREIGDYIAELHDYLWKFVDLIIPGASGKLDDYVDKAISHLQAGGVNEELLEACRKARQFITNGVELGYITLPEKGDSALETLPMLEHAISNAEKELARGDIDKLIEKHFQRVEFDDEICANCDKERKVKWCERVCHETEEYEYYCDICALEKMINGTIWTVGYQEDRIKELEKQLATQDKGAGKIERLDEFKLAKTISRFFIDKKIPKGELCCYLASEIISKFALPKITLKEEKDFDCWKWLKDWLNHYDKLNNVKTGQEIYDWIQKQPMTQ